MLEMMADSEIRLPDGRTVAFAESGRPDGRPVLLLHMSPGSRRHDADPAATAAAGVRLLTVDRPGYGRSSPPAGLPTVAAAVDDVAAGLAALGVGPVDVVGWSGGGVRAAALAARHPDLVRSLALVGTPAHDDDVPWIPDGFRPLTGAGRADPEAAVPRFVEALGWYAEDPAAVVEGVGAAADAPLLRHPVHGPALAACMVEGARQGALGLACDLVGQHVLPWGFRGADIAAPTTCWYGELDDLVALDHGRHWAATVPGAELRVVPGVGHLLAISRWADILGAGG